MTLYSVFLDSSDARQKLVVSRGKDLNLSNTINRRKFLSFSLGALGSSALLPVSSAIANPTQSFVVPLLPRRLRTGMVVGVVAPSSNPLQDEEIRYALDVVDSLGFKIKPAENLFSRKGYLAGEDAARAKAVNDMFSDDSVDAIFALQGGYGATRILPLLDFDLIRHNPKILLGYSDITALFSAIHRRTGLVTFHGPIARQEFTDYTYNEFKRVLIDGAPGMQIGSPPPFEVGPGRVEKENRLQTLVEGTASGPMVGGNLSLVASLLGTSYETVFNKSILILEDVDEAPYSIDRMLTSLRLAGVFERIAGLVLGKFTDCDSEGPTLSLEAVFQDRCGDLDVPVLRGLMIGHVPDQTVVPLGAIGKLDSTRQTLTVSSPFFSD